MGFNVRNFLEALELVQMTFEEYKKGLDSKMNSLCLMLDKNYRPDMPTEDLREALDRKVAGYQKEIDHLQDRFADAQERESQIKHTQEYLDALAEDEDLIPPGRNFI